MNENSLNSRMLLKRKLNKLRQLRSDSDSLFRGLEGELTIEADRVKNRSNTIDAVGMVATVSVSLGSLIRKGFGAMRLSGDALEKVNQELAKDGLHVAYDPARDILVDHAGEQLGAHRGLRHYFGTALHVFANLTTPSYWAVVYVNVRDGKSLDQVANSRVETLVDDSVRKIREQRRKTIARIDIEIRQTQALLR